jgi:hypothetical protein
MSQAPKDLRPAIDLSKYKIVKKWVSGSCIWSYHLMLH